MLLIFFILFTSISGLLWYRTRDSNRYRLDILTLICGGALIMFFIDSLYSYLEEGIFIEFTVETFTLSIILILSAIILWLIILVIKNYQDILKQDILKKLKN